MVKLSRTNILVITSLILITALVIVSYFYQGLSSTHKPGVLKGIVNLSKYDIEKDHNSVLDGKWEFYWKKFLDYDNLKRSKPDAYVSVPDTWNGYLVHGRRLPGQGYATYRLHVKTDLYAGTQLGLRLNTFSSAYKLYINKKLVAASGKVAKLAAKEVGQYKPQAVFFNIPAKQFDIIIHISNFEHAKGGFWYSMYIGSVKGILDYHVMSIGKEIFLMGVLFIIFIFYMALYFLMREFKYFLYFSLLCLFMIISLDTVGQCLVVMLIPTIPLKVFTFIWYSSTTWVLFLFILFLHELFKSGLSTFMVRIYLACSILSQLLFTITQPAFYTRFADVSNFLGAACIFCTIIIAAIGIREKKDGGWLNVAGILVVLLTYIHDVLFWTNKISSNYGEMIYIGLCLFLLLQMLIQANRMKLSFKHEVAAELSFLQAQIKPHFIYNALNTFISISRYDIEKARELLIDFSNYLRRSFDFKNISQMVTLEHEIELVKSYVEIEKARFEDILEVLFVVPDNLSYMVPVLVLQPVIENAIKHGILPKDGGGRIEVLIELEDKILKFMVRDNGIGMDMKKKDILSRTEYGNGVGLSNIDNRLKRLYGKGVSISSSPGIGTEVTWYVPADGGGIE